MLQETITPAIEDCDDLPLELTTEEFQKQLYEWFEQRGLLAKLRAHLRKQMIGALNDTTMGRTVAIQHQHNLSPKIQAYNLLIGEFLLYHNYFYSLSVFSTEVPLTNILPDIPITLNSHENEHNRVAWKFEEKDMWDIIETLNIDKESEIGKRVYTTYFSESDQPLLTCVLRLSNQKHPTVNMQEPFIFPTTYADWIKSIAEILQSNNVAITQIKDILNSISTIINNEKQHMLKEFKNKYTEKEAELHKRLEEEKRKLNVVENAKPKPQSNTQQKLEVEDYGVKVLRHQSILQERYHQLLIKENEIQKRDTALHEREDILEAKIKELENSYRMLQDNNTQELPQLKRSVEINVPEIDIDTIKRLEIENKALQTVNEDQRRRIDELTERSALLLRDLESTQTAISIMTNNNQMGRLSAPTLTIPPFKPSSFFTKRSEAIGNRSGNSFASEYKIPNMNDPNFLFSTSSSDEGTSGSNLLKEARERLKRLEEESEKVDRNYQQFKLRRAQEGYSVGQQFSPNSYYKMNKQPISRGVEDLEKSGDSDPHDKSSNSASEFPLHSVGPNLRYSENAVCKDINNEIPAFTSTDLDELSIEEPVPHSYNAHSRTKVIS